MELLKGEKDLNSLATENNIQPNLLRNWKKEFSTTLPQCSMTSVRKTSKTSLLKNAREKAEYAKRLVS
ncbi:MAG: hypothetical protein ACLR0U_08025 [Enterocloster clostridioformis]